jgi:hypothetical protein
MPSEFEYLQLTPSDINEHLGTLRDLAKECTHITEMGVRYVVSTWAFAEGLESGKLISIDIKHPHEFQSQYRGGLEGVEDLCKAKGVEFQFILGDTLEVEIEPTELLFIDTLHEYEHLKMELEKHGDKATKYLVFHDTTSCPELNRAIDEFMDENDEWIVKDIYTNNNGLTILRRVGN